MKHFKKNLGVLFGLLMIISVCVLFVFSHEEKNISSSGEILHGKATDYKDFTYKNSSTEILKNYKKSARTLPRKKIKPIQIILYDPSCEDCKVAKNQILKNIEQEANNSNAFKLLVVKVSKGHIPKWIYEINGLTEDGVVFTPTVYNGKLSYRNHKYEWEMISKYSGTDDKKLNEVMNYGEIK